MVAIRTLVNKPLAQTTRDDAREDHRASRSERTEVGHDQEGIVLFGRNRRARHRRGQAHVNPFAKLASVGDDVCAAFRSAMRTWRCVGRTSISSPRSINWRFGSSPRAACDLRRSVRDWHGHRASHQAQRPARQNHPLRQRHGSREGVRYCVAGTKTENSTRRVPFSASVLPYLPAQITGPVLEGDSDGTSSRLNAWLVTSASMIRRRLCTRSATARRINSALRNATRKLPKQFSVASKVTMGDKYGG